MFWAIAQGVDGEFGWRSCETYNPNKYFDDIPYEEWNNAKPGDILAYHDPNRGAGGHVSMIVGNDVKSNRFIIAEVSSEKNGIRLNDISYEEAYAKYKVKNLSVVYGDNFSDKM